MYILYAICAFMLSSSSIMVGYVWVRDIKNTRTQRAASMSDKNGENTEDMLSSEEALAEYPNLLKRTA